MPHTVKVPLLQFSSVFHCEAGYAHTNSCTLQSALRCRCCCYFRCIFQSRAILFACWLHTHTHKMRTIKRVTLLSRDFRSMLFHVSFGFRLEGRKNGKGQIRSFPSLLLLPIVTKYQLVKNFVPNELRATDVSNNYLNICSLFFSHCLYSYSRFRTFRPFSLLLFLLLPLTLCCCWCCCHAWRLL